MIRIGLMGLDFCTKNKGCDALSYSFVHLLSELPQDDTFDIYVFSKFGFDERLIRDIFPAVEKIKRVDYHNLKSPETIIRLIKAIKCCDCVFDFTFGDSFTDIYGKQRFINCAILMELCILCHVPLILCPQTIGPFNYSFARNIARHIIKKAYYVCSRDGASAKYVFKLTGRKIDEYIDVAFALPYEVPKESFRNDCIKIGFNVSGLLWNNGYTRSNEFGLSVDYKNYCLAVLKKLTNCDNFEIHLIGHVIEDGSSSVDNDLPVILELSKQFPSCKVAPIFDNPIEAKNYICQMDVMIAARMHASIAAFSSGVPVIPFAYSRKVNGLYDTLNYPFFIDGKAEMTDDAIDRTLKFIESMAELKVSVDAGNKYAQQQIERLSKKIREILSGL